VDSFSHFNVAHHTWDVGIVEILSKLLTVIINFFWLNCSMHQTQYMESRPEGTSNPSLLAQLNKIIVARTYSTSKA
jgi:hypothetical protein